MFFLIRTTMQITLVNPKVLFVLLQGVQYDVSKFLNALTITRTWNLEHGTWNKLYYC